MFGLIMFMLLNQNTSTEIKQVHREIQILNLVNGLEFSENQMEFILEKAKEAETVREDFYDNIEYYKNDIYQIFSQLKENRMEDDAIPNTLKKRVFYAEEKMNEYKQEMFESLEMLAKDVENMLDGNQTYALEHYVACLIPPPGESRIGQSDKPLGLTKQLERIRKLPDWAYEVKKYEIADKAVEKIKSHLRPGTVFDSDVERLRILDLLDEIRSLSDVDFALKEEDYIDQIRNEYLPEKIPVNLTVKIERFLLDPLIIPILEEKINSR